MSEVFVDTSALYALVVSDDRWHDAARVALENLESERAGLVTSSFVLHEVVTLLQARCGIDIVRRFHDSLLPLMSVVWIDEAVYGGAVTALSAAARRSVSFTDWSSFEIMRRRRARRAFAFDPHFAEQGFELIPAP